MKFRTEKVIDTADWDKLVMETYGKPYCFQQQEGCKDRGVFRFTVPDEAYDEDMHDSIPEVVDHPTKGVKFEAWQTRNPNAPLLSEEKGCREESWAIALWWNRNFYPDFQTVANDLYYKGVLEAGEYTINIDW